jgi:hypothetical protein
VCIFKGWWVLENDPSNSVGATTLHESVGVRLRTDTEADPIRTKYWATVSFNSKVYSVYRRQTPVQYLIKTF